MSIPITKLIPEVLSGDYWKNGDGQLSAGPLHRFARPFRQLVGHARIVPYLADLLGKQFRYDHGHAMLMRRGGGPFELHGGGVPRLPGIRYEVADGQIRSELLVVEYALCDVGETDGGLCVLPGSHKSNFKVPQAILDDPSNASCVVVPPVPAGSVILFSEALVHATAAWRCADHPRRALLVKYSQKHITQGQDAVMPRDVALTERQRLLFSPPQDGRANAFHPGDVEPDQLDKVLAIPTR